MAANSKIEWTDQTWNPVLGCSKVSPGCAHCYAEVMACRLAAMAWADIAAGKDPGRKRYYTLVVDVARKRWNGKLVPVPEALADPQKWVRPRRVFVNSMSDLFHRHVPFDFVAKVYAAMALAEQHVFQVLTKRPERAARFQTFLQAHWPTLFPFCKPDAELNANVVLDFLSDEEAGTQVSQDCFPAEWPLDNVWLGTSIESRDYLHRIGSLRACPAAVRFLSLEPLLQDLGTLDLRGIDWVIVGGESGPGARRMDARWVRSIRDQCQQAGVPFFFKQWGGVQKAAHGRELDGRTWDELPAAAHSPLTTHHSPAP